MSPSRLLSSAAAAAMLLLAGCQQQQPYALADDISIHLDAFFPGGDSDDLHLPYVRGGQVNLTILNIEGDDLPSDFTFESGSPSVLRIDKQSQGNADCTAVGEGTAEIRVLRLGVPVYSKEIHVAAPTRASLQPSGPVFVGAPLDIPANGSTNVLVGGTATYLVRYFAGDTELYGNGVLAPIAPMEAGARAEQTFLSKSREWLQVSPTAKGPLTVGITADGTDLGTLTVNVVDESAVKKVDVDAQDTSKAKDGDLEYVLAQAFDDAAEPIFGVDYTWDRSGVEQTGEGDLFAYTFEENANDSLTAHFGALSATTTIQAGQSSVDSSNFVGCSAAPGAPSRGALGMALAALGIAAAARRRRR